MERNLLDEDYLRRYVARYRQLVGQAPNDPLVEHYWHLAELLEQEADSWKRMPLRPLSEC